MTSGIILQPGNAQVMNLVFNSLFYTPYHSFYVFTFSFHHIAALRSVKLYEEKGCNSGWR